MAAFVILPRAISGMGSRRAIYGHEKSWEFPGTSTGDQAGPGSQSEAIGGPSPVRHRGPVSTVAGRLAVAGKTSVTGSDCQTGGSVNSKSGSVARRKRSHALPGYTGCGSTSLRS